MNCAVVWGLIKRTNHCNKVLAETQFLPESYPPTASTVVVVVVVVVVAHALLVALLRTPFRRVCPPGGYPYMPHVSHGLPADLSPGSSLLPHNNVNNLSPGAGGSYARPAMVSRNTTHGQVTSRCGQVSVRVWVWVRACVHACVCVCVCTHACSVCVCMCSVYVCICNIYIYIYIYILAYIYI